MWHFISEIRNEEEIAQQSRDCAPGEESSMCKHPGVRGSGVCSKD